VFDRASLSGIRRALRLWSLSRSLRISHFFGGHRIAGSALLNELLCLRIIRAKVQFLTDAFCTLGGKAELTLVPHRRSVAMAGRHHK